jgi:hypothetical protein
MHFTSPSQPNRETVHFHATGTVILGMGITELINLRRLALIDMVVGKC